MATACAPRRVSQADGIITGFDIAIGSRHALTGINVNAIAPAGDGHVANDDVTAINRMRGPIASLEDEKSSTARPWQETNSSTTAPRGFVTRRLTISGNQTRACIMMSCALLA